MSEEQLEEQLFPRKVLAGRQVPQLDWKYVNKELKRKSVTLSLLWVEYRQEHAGGYGYSQFCQRYREWKKHLNPTMRQRHKAYIWDKYGSYNGIPLQNYLGWYLATYTIFQIFALFIYR
jgi:hypothetical protein